MYFGAVKATQGQRLIKIANNVDAARLKRRFECPRRAVKAGRGQMADDELDGDDGMNEHSQGQDASDAFSVQDVGGIRDEPDTQPADNHTGDDVTSEESESAEKMVPASLVSDIVRKRLERERRKWSSEQESPKKNPRKREKEPSVDVSELESQLEYLRAKADVSEVLSESGYRLNRRQRELVIREYLNSGDEDPLEFISDFVEGTLALKPNTASVQQASAPKRVASNPPGRPASAGAPKAGSTFEVTGDILQASRDELQRLGSKKVVQLLEQQLRGRKILPPTKKK